MINKEQIYDEEIQPLMEKILKICQNNKISVLASFHTPNLEDPDLMCTSALLGEDGDAYQTPVCLRRAYSALFKNTSGLTAAFTISSGS